MTIDHVATFRSLFKTAAAVLSPAPPEVLDEENFSVKEATPYKKFTDLKSVKAKLSELGVEFKDIQTSIYGRIFRKNNKDVAVWFYDEKHNGKAAGVLLVPKVEPKPGMDTKVEKVS